MTMTSSFGEPIHTYTRREALADGELVDVSSQARELGWRAPVAITAAVQALLEACPNSWESYRGRLHDVLWMAACSARRNRGSSRFTFQVIVTSPDAPRSGARALVELVSDIGPGDDAEPVITIGYSSDF